MTQKEPQYRAARAPRLAKALGLVLLPFAFAASSAAWAQSADMVFSQHNVDPAGSITAGSRATFTLKITNNGPDLAQGVILTDTLPPNSTFVSMTFPGGSCSPLAGSPPTQYQCALGDIPFDPSGGVEVKLVLDFPNAGYEQNTGQLAATTPDSNLANNTSSVGTTVVVATNLRLTATSVADDDAIAGAPIDFTLKIDNPGRYPLAAGEKPTVKFDVPAGVTLTGIPNGEGWACTPPAANYPISNPPATNTAITCTRDDALPSGAAFPEITVPAVGNVNGTVTADFGVTFNHADGNPADNTQTVSVPLVDGTDMAIDKTVNTNGGAVSPGGRVRYTLQAIQNGGVSPTDVTIVDTLPAGITYDPATFNPPAPWQCDWSDQSLTCVYPGQYTGGAFTKLPSISFDAIVGAGGADPIVNVGMVSALQADPDSSNDSSEASISTSVSSDQRLVKTASMSPVTVGKNYSYKLATRNLGPANVQAGQVISVRDDIPAGMSLTGVPTGAGWTCGFVPARPAPVVFPVAGPVTVACTRQDGIGTPANWADITVPVVNTQTGPSSNTACVALASAGGQPADNNAANNCSTVNLTVNDVNNSTADLAITKTVSTPSVVVGGTVTYTMSVTNLGPDDSTKVVITDPIRNLLFVANSLNNIKGVAPQGNATCTPTNGAYINPDVICTFPLLKVGDTATMSFDAIPSNNTAATKAFLNKASVKSNDVEDPKSSNNEASVWVDVIPGVDLVAAKTVTPAVVRVGEPMIYTISAINNGPSAAADVSLVDTLPANTTFLELNSVSAGGVCSTPAVGAATGTISCTWPATPVKTQHTATFRLLPTKDATNTTVVNNVVASTTTSEPNLSNNAASASVDVKEAVLDILVQKTDTVDPVALGEMTEYILTISNVGPSNGSNLVVTDTFPNAKASARFSYQGGLTTSEPATQCVEPKVGATTGKLECTFPTITVGKDITIHYKMKAESITTEGDYGGTQGNDVSVKVDETETLLTNNVATEDTTTRRDAIVTDLSIKKAVDKAAMKAGENATYTLVVTNHGPSASDGAQIIDNLPAGMTFVASASGCVNSDAVVTCSVGKLANGASTTFSFDVTLVTPYTGASPIVNTATVDAPGDTNPSNNKDSVTTTVTPDVPPVDPPVDPKPVPAPVPTLDLAGLLAMLVLTAATGVLYLRRKS